jgi:hypothetical protein
MTSYFSRFSSTLLLLYFAAASAGAALAFADPSTRAERLVLTAPHCTKYGPNLLAPDSNCYINSQMAANGLWQTPSVAWRETNEINVNAHRNLCVEYVNSPLSPACATGALSVGMGGDSSAQRKAQCTMTGASVFGNCTTEWHD